ncbi:LPXTG cell wall anchor domain-containing protein [Enterococcus sp. 669A]|uniref:LPXTG cell wall anchor domain-containing protein n=1 Tax=Candidatus Enterococcus moelleringii TaxID=2815325 RepID=A0ABS3LE25_9ENTE|nr:LPXTG cell wall anchor domain-containing protein [Enterococcus sp. 669A]MBO1307873.1 LPXTG cell wall anchor domain-containing protein [Enterococcus sp. 669A]
MKQAISLAIFLLFVFGSQARVLAADSQGKSGVGVSFVEKEREHAPQTIDKNSAGRLPKTGERTKTNVALIGILLVGAASFFYLSRDRRERP